MLTLRPLYPRGGDPGTHWMGGLVGPRVGMGAMAKGETSLPLPGNEPRPSNPYLSHFTDRLSRLLTPQNACPADCCLCLKIEKLFVLHYNKWLCYVRTDGVIKWHVTQSYSLVSLCNVKAVLHHFALITVQLSCSCVFCNWASRHEGVLGSGGIAPHILDLGTRWRWAVSYTPRPLYPQRKSRSYLLDRSLGGPQSRSGHGGEEKNSQPLPGLEPRSSSPYPSAIPTELSGLRN
jgi:hypothetical protein